MISNITKAAARIAIRNIPTKTIHFSQINNLQFGSQNCIAGPKLCYGFAKISKKDKDRQKDKEEKKKVKEELGDASEFDLNPIEQKYSETIESLKQQTNQLKIGRLDQSFFQNIFVRIGNNSVNVQQLAEIAPKNANTVVLNPYDNGNLDAIQKAVQSADLGFQLTRVEKTIVVNQPPNSMKELKQKMMQRLKKIADNKRNKINDIRVSGREDLKKYKKIVSEERLKIIEKELKTMHDKFVEKSQKIIKEKENELNK